MNTPVETTAPSLEPHEINEALAEFMCTPLTEEQEDRWQQLQLKKTRDLSTLDYADAAQIEGFRNANRIAKSRNYTTPET